MAFVGWGGAALVTGASSGIGLALSRSLAQRGMDLLLVARSSENLRVLAQRLSVDHNVRAIALPVDLAAPDGVAGLLSTLSQVELEVDLLVNNAGIGVYGPFANQGREREAEMIRLNVSAPTELATAFLPGMLRRRRGVILNVASTAGFAPTPYLASYGGTKSYIVQWTIALDTELEGTGVRACVLVPGTTSSNFQNVSGAAKHREKKFFEQSAEQVATECLRGLDRGKRVIVSGWLNRLHVLGAGLLPRSLASRIAARVNRPKKLL